MSKADNVSNSTASKAKHRWNSEEENVAERALVLVPDFRNSKSSLFPNAEQTEAGSSTGLVLERSLDARIEEAVGLARAISLDVVSSIGVSVRKQRPATLFGKGKVEEIAGVVSDLEVGLAIIDHAISPVQQQNLENAWNCKVLDRTALILEIFGERAQTREGRAQVELAHLNYQKGRLVRSWTHLERQRGALGFVGGPGETQIEADRRMISERINRLEKQLEKIQRTRALHRAKRQKIPYPVIALVGYTNAGKSTLFNKLTGSQVYVRDQLFATLDPTLRQLLLPEGTKVILSDTVGFVSNLPTHLIAAFRATLEEVIEADLIIHVRDISDPDTNVQSRDVYQVMEQLGVNCDDKSLIVEAWNKTDLLSDEQRISISRLRTGYGGEHEPALVSSVTGDGVETLLKEIEKRISSRDDVIEITLGVNSLGKLNWVYKNTRVLEREDREDGAVRLKLRANPDLFQEIGLLDNG